MESRVLLSVEFTRITVVLKAKYDSRTLWALPDSRTRSAPTHRSRIRVMPNAMYLYACVGNCVQQLRYGTLVDGLRSILSPLR